MQSALEDECDKIVSKFCLSSEDVAYNLKVLYTKAQNKLKEPNKECQLMDICTKKVYELARKNKKYHPIYLLQKAINFYIISLASNPYIAKIIFSYYLKSASISTYPTEKGKVLLNYANPSFKVKKIGKQDLSKFIDNIKANENNFSEIYLDIEKCEKEGLINFDIEIDMTSIHIQELIKLLNMAINGQKEEVFENSEKKFDDKNENMTDSEETEFNKMKSDIRNNYLVRKIAIKNMILDKEFTQKYFINYIKKLCHNMAERYLIERISNKFYNEILNKKYIKNKIYDVDDNDKYCYSIFFINMNTFCYIAVDKNKKIKYKNILKTEILSEEENDLKNEMYSHLPKYIILGINNIGSYKLINYFQENDSIIFSDYLSLLKIPKQYKMNFTNEKDYFYSIAYDQYKYTMDPLEFFIENYNFKYEKNLILNLKLHYLQEQINDIPLLNYCLETQIRRALNLYKFKYEKGKNPTENYYSFMNGLGPLTSKLIDDYKNRTLTELKNVTGENILKNIYPFIYTDINNMIIEEEGNFVYHFQIEEIFNKMINSFHAIKKKSIYNVFVDSIDEKNKVINCVLFYNENALKCFLPFINIDEYITDIKGYFKKYKILLCKIKNLQIERGEIRIVLSNKIQDLEYLENSYEDQDDYGGLKELKEEDKLIKIENLKNIVDSQKILSERYLKKLNEEENEYIKNIFLEEIKKDFISIEESGKFLFRPSFLGADNLILTLSFCENLTLNYNISKEKDGTYILENKSYQSLNEIVKKFVNPLLKLTNEFKQNKYFKSPSKIEALFSKIFNCINENNTDDDNKNSNANNNKFNENDSINICFMNDSPNYGILITLNKNNSVNIDFIELSPEGFYFHNKLFDNINLIIEYYLENNEKQFYKDFICENIISDSHSKLEYIDLKYKEFNDQMLTKLNWSLEPNENNKEKEKEDDKIFLGKKRDKEEPEFSGWGNDKSNIKKDNEIFSNNNNINSINNENYNNGSFWSNDKNNENENDNYISKSWNNDTWQNQDNNYSNNNNINQDNNNNNYLNENSNNNNNNNFWNESNNANFSGTNNNFNRNNNNFYKNNSNNNSKNNNKFWNNKDNNNYNNNSNNNYKFNHNDRNGNKNRFNNGKKNDFNSKYNNKKNNNSNGNNQESNFSWSVNPQNNNDANDESNSNNNYINNNNSNDFWGNNQDSEEANNSKNKDHNYENSVKQNHLEWSIYQENSQSNNTIYNISNNNSYSYNINNNRQNNNHNNNNNNRFNKKNYFNNQNNDNKSYNFNKNNYYNNKSPYKEKNNNKYSSQYHGNNNYNNKGFNQRKDNYKFNKKKNLWANELNKNRKEDDIKTDGYQGPIDFEKIDSFGGYNVNKEENGQNNNNFNGNTNDNNDQNQNNQDFW